MSDNFFGKLFGGGSSTDKKDKAPEVRTPGSAPAKPGGAAPTRPTPPAPSRPTPPSAAPTAPAAPTRPAAPTNSQPTRPTAMPPQTPARPAGIPPQTTARPTGVPSQAPARPTGIPSHVSPAPARPASPPPKRPTMASDPSMSEVDEYNIDDLLRLVVEKGGSDLHLTVGTPPMLRMQGKLWPTDLPVLSTKDTRRLIFQFLTNEQREKLEKNLELDISYEIAELSRYRCNIFYTRLGMAAVFRVIPTTILTLQQLKMPPVLGDLARRNKGMVLVTGPTGSGKSTTLAAMVDLVNNERQDHILTIEDPIEFVHQHKNSLVNQRELGVNTWSFANALKSALREDPDVILVGELRDYETISLAVTAAETGHLVFATLHTPSAAQSVDRIVDVFPAHQQDQIRTQLADALQGILAQQLIPTIDGMSRAVALEILINTSAVSNLIRENKTFQLPSIMQTSKQVGMQTMDQSLMDLVKQRKISPQEAYRRAADKKAFEQYKPREF